MSLIGIARCLRDGEPEPPLAAFFIPIVLPNAVVGVPYSADTGAAYGEPPYTFVKIAGPAWLSVDPATGAISGTPDVAGVGVVVTVEVTDGALNTAQVTDTIDVAAAPVLTAFFVPASLPDAFTGVPYNAGTSAINGDTPYTFSKIAGPAWLNVDPNTGALSGTPSAAAAGVTVTIRATDETLAFDDVTDTIDVIASTVLSAVFVPTPLPDAEVGTPYSADTNAVNGTAPYTFVKAAGPSWVNVDPVTGAITGTPTSAAVGVIITVGVTDATTAYAEVTDTIDIGTAPVETVLFGGEFTTVNAVTHNRLARTSMAGVVEAGFVPSVTGTSVNALAIQADAQIVLGGGFTQVNATGRVNLARIDEDGALDGGFNPAPDDVVYAVAMRSDDIVLVAGTYANIAGGANANFVGLNPDGTLNFASNASDTVHAVLVLTGDKCIISGAFNFVDVFPRSKLAQLNTDGTVDTGFVPPSVSGTIFSLGLQSDGKIIGGGNFTAVGATSQDSVARFNADGSHDAAYAPVINANVDVVAVQSDNKTIICGPFTLVNGVARTRIARLSSTGATDAGFTATINGAVLAVHVQDDGKILIGGEFTLVNGSTRNHIARLNSDGTLDATFNPNANNDVLCIVQ